MYHMTLVVGYEKPRGRRNAARTVSAAMVTFVVEGGRKYFLVPQSQRSRTGVAHSCAHHNTLLYLNRVIDRSTYVEYDNIILNYVT